MALLEVSGLRVIVQWSTYNRHASHWLLVEGEQWGLVRKNDPLAAAAEGGCWLLRASPAVDIFFWRRMQPFLLL